MVGHSLHGEDSRGFTRQGAVTWLKGDPGPEEARRGDQDRQSRSWGRAAELSLASFGGQVAGPETERGESVPRVQRGACSEQPPGGQAHLAQEERERERQQNRRAARLEERLDGLLGGEASGQMADQAQGFSDREKWLEHLGGECGHDGDEGREEEEAGCACRFAFSRATGDEPERPEKDGGRHRLEEVENERDLHSDDDLHDDRKEGERIRGAGLGVFRQVASPGSGEAVEEVGILI